MRLSIIIPVFDSHKVVRRQIRHFNGLALPPDVEIILMDDNSNPPLREVFPNYKDARNLGIYPTCDKRPWSNACAKNLGAKIAEGEYLFFTDIDHILPIEAIRAAHQFTGDKMEFTRQFAVLTNRAKITQDRSVLRKYGHRRKRVRTYRHTNTFAMKREIFWAMGGYNEDDCDWGRQDHRDDTHLHNKYRRFRKSHGFEPAVVGPVTYVFPGTQEDPQGLFHKLERYIGVEAMSTAKSYRLLCRALDTKDRVTYTRFGDSDMRVMWGGRGALRHKVTSSLRREFIRSFSMSGSGYLKAAVVGYKEEPGMSWKAFRYRESLIERARKIAAELSKDRLYYNPIVFHYMALYHPKRLRKFVNRYIRPKKKIFVGGNNKPLMEAFYGPIDFYVRTSRRDAYHSTKEWWPAVEKNLDRCNVVLPSVGAASRAVCRKVWESGYPIHCIDIGSLNDVLEGRLTRGWPERMGVDTVKRNLLGG